MKEYVFSGLRGDYTTVTLKGEEGTLDHFVKPGAVFTQAEVDSFSDASKQDMERWRREGVVTVRTNSGKEK